MKIFVKIVSCFLIASLADATELSKVDQGLAFSVGFAAAQAINLDKPNFESNDTKYLCLETINKNELMKDKSEKLYIIALNSCIEQLDKIKTK